MKYLIGLFVTLGPTAAHAATKPITLRDTPLSRIFTLPPGGRPLVRPPPVVASSLDFDLGQAFWRLRAKAIETKFPLSSWFRDQHVVYVLGQLPPADRPKLLRIFEYLIEKMDEPGRASLDLLNHAPYPEVVAAVHAIEGRVQQLKHQHKAVIRLAIAKHEVEIDQRYGDQRYSYHLRAVREVLKRFGFGPKDSYLGLFVGTAAWLHDILEDTDLTFAKLRDLVGLEMATTVWAVTKRRKWDTDTGEWNTVLSLAKTGLYRSSRLLKLADRIANVEEGMIRLFRGEPTKVHKYIEDWPRFFEALYVEGEADAMWGHLQGLLTDARVAHQFATHEFMRCEVGLTK